MQERVGHPLLIQASSQTMEGITLMFNALSAVKFVASGIVGIGTGKIVGRIIRNNITPETLVEKVSVTAAAWVIGSMAAKATKQYTDEIIDETATSVKEVVENIKTAGKLSRINKGESGFESEGLDKNDFVQDKDLFWSKKVTVKSTTEDALAQIKKLLDEVQTTSDKNA